MATSSEIPQPPITKCILNITYLKSQVTSPRDQWVNDDNIVGPGGGGGRFENAYKLLNLRALEISMLYKNHIFQCMGKIFCVEFQSVPLKFHTKYLTHTLKDVENAYKLLNLRALEISMLYKNHIFQCMGKIFCVEFQSVPLKFHTKYLTHTLKDVNFFIHRWRFKSSLVFDPPPPPPQKSDQCPHIFHCDESSVPFLSNNTMLSVVVGNKAWYQGTLRWCHSHVM